MRIGLGFHAAVAYKYDAPWKYLYENRSLGIFLLSVYEIGPKYFGPVYFQKAKLQFFLHFGLKFREVNKAQAENWNSPAPFRMQNKPSSRNQTGSYAKRGLAAHTHIHCKDEETDSK